MSLLRQIIIEYTNTYKDWEQISKLIPKLPEGERNEVVQELFNKIKDIPPCDREKVHEHNMIHLAECLTKKENIPKNKKKK